MKRYLALLITSILFITCLYLPAPAQSGRNRPATPKTKADKGPTRSETTASSTNNIDPTAPIASPSIGGEIIDDDVATLKIDATLVTVPVVVSDQTGRYVPFLKPEDFRLFEDRVKQEISFFASEKAPFDVAIVMDTSGSIKDSMEAIQDSAIRFVRELGEDDQVMIVEFNSKVEVLNELTSDRNKIRSSIRSTRAGGGTRLYDALYEAGTRMRSVDRRKAIILLTDGEDTESRRNGQKAMEAVLESGALMYVIQFPESEQYGYSGGGTIGGPPTFPGGGGIILGRGRRSPTGYPDSTFLRSLVDQTGGDIYQAGGRAGLPNVWHKIADELRHVYVLGYYPTNSLDNGGNRRIKVELSNRESGKIRYKPGYSTSKKSKSKDSDYN